MATQLRSGVEPLRMAYPPAVIRAAVIAGALLVAFAVHLAVAPWSTAAAMEADLLRLLRTMVLIKAGIGAALAGFVLWRLDHAIDRPTAVAYAAGVAALGASLAWLWALVLVPLASLLFYASVAALLIVAHRDRSLFGFLDAVSRRQSPGPGG
jgi:hypothetical protein